MEFVGTESQMNLYNAIGTELCGYDVEDVIVVLHVLLYEMVTEGNDRCR